MLPPTCIWPHVLGASWTLCHSRDLSAVASVGRLGPRAGRGGRCLATLPQGLNSNVSPQAATAYWGYNRSNAPLTPHPHSWVSRGGF
jgi:hypothetical protein